MTSETGTNGGAKAWLDVTADDPFVEISILDGELREVPLERNSGSVRVEVPLGLYQIEMKVGDATQTSHAALLRSGETVQVRPDAAVQFSSAVPVADTRTFRQDHIEAATALCAGPAIVRGPDEGGLVLFVRDPAEPGDPRRIDDDALDLLSWDGTELFDLRADGRTDARAGWAGAHLQLAAGTYRLRFRTRTGTHEQGVVVADGFCTQAFLLARPHWGDEKRLSVDAASLSVLMARSGLGLDARLPDFRTTEVALQAVAAGRRLRGVDPYELLPRKFENPMLGLYGAHLLVSGDTADVDGELVREILANLHAILGPIADVGALRLAFARKLGRDPLAGLSGWPEVAPMQELPTLYAGWKRWVQASYESPELVGRGSPADRIAGGARASGPWLSWAADAMDADLPDAGEDVTDAVDDLARMLKSDLGRARDLLIDPNVPALAKRVAQQMVPIDDVFDTVHESVREPARELAQRLRVPIASARRAAAGALDALRKRSKTNRG